LFVFFDRLAAIGAIFPLGIDLFTTTGTDRGRGTEIISTVGAQSKGRFYFPFAFGASRAYDPFGSDNEVNQEPNEEGKQHQHRPHQRLVHSPPAGVVVDPDGKPQPSQRHQSRASM